MKFIYFIEQSTFEEGNQVLAAFETKEGAQEWLKEKYEELEETSKYTMIGNPENEKFVSVQKVSITTTQYKIVAKKLRY